MYSLHSCIGRFFLKINSRTWTVRVRLLERSVYKRATYVLLFWPKWAEAAVRCVWPLLFVRKWIQVHTLDNRLIFRADHDIAFWFLNCFSHCLSKFCRLSLSKFCWWEIQILTDSLHWLTHGNLHAWKGRLSAKNTLGGLKFPFLLQWQ